MSRELTKGDALINFTLSKELVRILRVLAAPTQDGGVQNIDRRKTKSRIPNLNIGWVDLACSAWVNGMECDHRENKAAGELVDFQGISPLGSTVVYPDKKEVRQNVAGDLHGWTKSSWTNSIHKKKWCQRWEWGQVTQDDCRGAIWVWRAVLRKAKAHLELSLESVNKNKTGYRCTVEGRLRGKRWTCWCMRKGTYWQGTWKRLRYQMPSSPS